MFNPRRGDEIKSAAFTLDSTSTWNLTADSVLTSLTDTGAISGTTIINIYGNGHTVYYDASLGANSALGGLTYSLANGGKLTPDGSTTTTTTSTTSTVQPMTSTTSAAQTTTSTAPEFLIWVIPALVVIAAVTALLAARRRSSKPLPC